MGDSGVAVRVLLVDDSGDPDRVARRLDEAARDPPVRVAVERDPLAALDRLGPVDCVVAAHDLPGTDGIDFAGAVAERDPSIPVVLFPEHGDEAVAAGAMAGHVVDYVPRDPDVTVPGTDGGPYRRLADCIAAAARNRRPRSDTEIAASRFCSLAESIPDPVVVVDDGARIRYVNPAVEAVFGYSPEAVRGDHVSVLFPAVPDGDNPFVTDRRRSGVELVGEHADGNEVPVRVSVGVFEDDGDRFFAGVIRSERQ